MLKNKSGMEYTTADRHYEFIYDNNSPLGELYDAVCVFKAHIASVIKTREEADAKKEKPKTPESS